MKISDIYKDVEKKVKANPRKCELCGAIETMDNLMLKYKDGDGSIILCDDCMLVYFPDFDIFD